MTIHSLSPSMRIALLAALLASVAASAQDGSLYQAAVARMTPAQPGAGGEQVGGVTTPASLVATPKANPKTFAKNELITIIISESASHTTNGSVSTSRDASIDAAVDQWVRLHLGDSGMVRPVNFNAGKPAVSAGVKREFDGSGTSSRSDRLIARIAGRIIDIRPNGNLVIEASKRISADEDAYSLTVTGVCRTADVTPDNTILSTDLAELEIVKTSEGAVKDATKRSWFQRVLDFFNLL